MKKIFLTCVIFSLIGCTSSNPTVTFVNEYSDSIDSIKIYTNKSCPALIFKNVKSGEKQKGEIRFCDEITGDGSYSIEVFQKGKIYQERGFGYYTNGNSLNDNFKITLGKFESIIIEAN